MNQKYQKNYIGIDVSKMYFDASLLPVLNGVKGNMVVERFDNNQQGLKQFKKWLQKHNTTFDLNTLVVLENTGLYHRLLEGFCHANQLVIHIGNAAHMKWSFGIARGKNDVIDSKRICEYAFKQEDDLKKNGVVPIQVTQLKDLMTMRIKLITQKNSIQTHLNELKLVNEKSVQQVLEQSLKSAIAGILKSIEKLEEQIKKLLKENENIKTNYRLLQTIPGIGPVIATLLICHTNNFAIQPSGKQLGSYAGVVPFEHSSGSSVRGKNRVHRMANKTLKSNLHMAALSAIQNYEEFKDYYQRKIAEGKHPLAVLNAIKNKLLLRVAAVIKNQQPYLQQNVLVVN